MFTFKHESIVILYQTNVNCIMTSINKPLTLQEIFRRNVEATLREMGLNASSLAKALGVSRQSVSSYLATDGNPGIKSIEAIGRALGKPPYVLLSPSMGIAMSDDRLSALERRLDAIERASQAELSRPGPGHLLPELEALAQEMQREIDADPLKKRVRKKGNG
jgi:transcriptional regulator with XRE-family HTH domain